MFKGVRTGTFNVKICIRFDIFLTLKVIRDARDTSMLRYYFRILNSQNYCMTDTHTKKNHFFKKKNKLELTNYFFYMTLYISYMIKFSCSEKENTQGTCFKSAQAR